VFKPPRLSSSDVKAIKASNRRLRDQHEPRDMRKVETLLGQVFLWALQDSGEGADALRGFDATFHLDGIYGEEESTYREMYKEITGRPLSSTVSEYDASRTKPRAFSYRRCRGNEALVDNCFTLHGRLFVANGTPSLRIWRTGTNRLLGILPPEEEIMPPCLLDKMSFQTSIYGDFTVCPFTRERPGEIQMVCIEEARHLLAETFPEAGTAKSYSRIEGCSLMGAPSQ